MTDGPANPGMDEEEEVDPGQPVAELVAFEHDASARFLGRIRNSIQRRTTAAQLTSFAFSMPLVLLKELWLTMVGQFEESEKGRQK
jgi:hypothetical protein